MTLQLKHHTTQKSKTTNKSITSFRIEQSSWFNFIQQINPENVDRNLKKEKTQLQSTEPYPCLATTEILILQKGDTSITHGAQMRV